MINLLWIINPISRPVKDNAQKYYDNIVNPKPGTFCVSTDNWDGKWNKMTPEDIANLQKEYDEYYNRDLDKYKKINDFLKHWSKYKVITEKQYWDLVLDKDILRVVYFFKYGDNVMIITGEWSDDDITEFLLDARMNWSDRII